MTLPQMNLYTMCIINSAGGDHNKSQVLHSVITRAALRSLEKTHRIF